MSVRSHGVPVAVMLVVGALAAAGCGEDLAPGGGDSIDGSGTIITESRDVDGFARVDLLVSGHMVIDVGPEASVMIEGDDNIVPLLTSIVVGDRLAFDLQRDTRISPSQEIVYRITTPTLQGVEIFGSGRVDARGIDGEEFEAAILGSGDVDLVGVATAVSIRIPGSGTVDAEAFPTSRATVSINGSGSALVNAADRLDVTINGSGSVTYLGTPLLTETINGSGNVAPA